MNIDLNRLVNGYEKMVFIDENIKISDELIKNTDLLAISDVHIKGSITLNSVNELVLDSTVTGVMSLPCAISLKPVTHKFSINITGELEKLLSEINENNKKVENSIDIFPIIWENILVEIPTKVISPDLDDVKKSGDGWRFIEEKSDKNYGLEKLKDLL